MKLKLVFEGSDVEDVVEWLASRFLRKAIWFDFINLTTGAVTHLKGDKMAYTLPVDKKVTAAIRPVDAYGNPAQVDGVPVWTVSDETLLEITPASDGMSCVIEPSGALGVTQLTVKGDADLGDGVKEIVGIVDIDCVAGEAAAFNVEFGPQEPN